MHVILLLVSAASARHIFLQQAVQLWPYRAQRKIYPCMLLHIRQDVIFRENFLDEVLLLGSMNRYMSNLFSK